MQMTTRTLIAAALGLTALSALAQDGYAQSSNTTYVRSGTGLCWHTSSFTNDKAVAECDPNLVPKKAEPAPVVAPAAPAVVEAPKAPVAPAAPAAPKKLESLTLNASSLFDLDKATLKPEGKDALSSVAKVLLEKKYEPSKTKIEVVGYTDRLGKAAHNQKLSEERANTTRDYLIAQGVPASMLVASGKGSSEPITKPEDCKKVMKNKKKLIACYAPDRRVEVSIYATVQQ